MLVTSMAAPASYRQRRSFRQACCRQQGGRIHSGRVHMSVHSTPPLRPLLLAGGLAALVLLSGCGRPGAGDAHAGNGPPPAPEVQVAEVALQAIRPWDEFNGRIEAVESVQLRSRVSGYIERIAFAEGQEVKKGQLLFVIDPRPYRAALVAPRPSSNARVPLPGWRRRRTSARASWWPRMRSRARRPTRGPQRWPRPRPRYVRQRPSWPPHGCSSTSPRCVRPSRAVPAAPCSPWATWPRPTRAC